MPSLLIPPSSIDALQNDQQSGLHPPSPTAPPYSPITPTMSNSLPALLPTEAADANNNSYNKNRNQIPYAYPSNPRSSYAAPPPSSNPYDPLPSTRPPPTPQMSEPPQSVPISESTNPDAIALRAAMSVLQLQRQQALRDMETLQKQKKAAVADPEAFARDVISGKTKARGMRNILGPVGELPHELSGANPRRAGELNGGSTDEAEDAVAMDEAEDEGDRHMAETVFGEIPSAQNVVRMPPINWTKYHVVGESLDKLHEEQRSRPVAGQPLRDRDLKPKQRAPEHVIASPYDPFKDKMDVKEKGRTRSGRGKG